MSASNRFKAAMVAAACLSLTGCGIVGATPDYAEPATFSAAAQAIQAESGESQFGLIVLSSHTWNFDALTASGSPYRVTHSFTERTVVVPGDNALQGRDYSPFAITHDLTDRVETAGENSSSHAKPTITIVGDYAGMGVPIVLVDIDLEKSGESWFGDQHIPASVDPAKPQDIASLLTAASATTARVHSITLSRPNASISTLDVEFESASSTTGFAHLSVSRRGEVLDIDYYNETTSPTGRAPQAFGWDALSLDVIPSVVSLATAANSGTLPKIKISIESAAQAPAIDCELADGSHQRFDAHSGVQIS